MVSKSTKKVDELIADLRQRGWSNDEIQKVVSLYTHSNSSKRFTLVVIYWLSLLVTIVANFLMTVIIILFLMTLPLPILYLVIVLIAFGFGSLLLLLLKDIRRLDPQHYVMISIFFPSMAFINVFIITTVSNILKVLLDLSIPNPMIVSLVYVYAFSIPYLWNLLKEGMVEENELTFWFKKKSSQK